MPIFKYTQREIITHTITIKAKDEEQADWYISELGDGDFPNSEQEWEDGSMKKVRSTDFDEDITGEES